MYLVVLDMEPNWRFAPSFDEVGLRESHDFIFFLDTFVFRIMYLRQIAVALRAYGTEVEEGC